MPRFSLFLAAGLLSLSAGAMAQPPEPPMRGPGAQGGRAAMQAPMQAPARRADLKAQLETTFDKLDANHDGKLSPDDRVAMRAERRDQVFARLDTNKDGAISKAEFAAAAATFGNREAAAGGPRDGGGRPDMMKRRGMMRHAAMMRGMGHDGPEGHRGGMMRGMGGPEGPMRAWMRDPVNQPVTRAAFLEHGLALFDKADTNHDGTISPAERDAARASMRDGPMRGKMPPPPPPGQ